MPPQSEANNVINEEGGVFKKKFIHQIWCGHYHAIAVVGEMRVNISPSTFIASLQTAFNDTLHKDMTLETPHGNKGVHGVLLSSLSNVVAQKAQTDKSNVNVTEEMKSLSSDQLDILLKCCYGFSSEINADDWNALYIAAKMLQLSELVQDATNAKGTGEKAPSTYY